MSNILSEQGGHLTAEQKKVAGTVIRVGKRMHKSPRDIVTALITGLQESGLTNPGIGAESSGGWRQERAIYFPNPTNVKASARRFYTELGEVGPGSVGERAQAVQKSAYPGLYQPHVKEAQAILKRLNRSTGTAVKTAPSASGGKAVTQALTKRIAGPGVSDAAKLNFIQNRNEPGAILDFALEKKALEANKTIRVAGTKQTGTKGSELKPLKPGEASSTKPLPGKHVGKWEKKYGVPAARLGGTHLYGGAVDIGSKVAKMFGLTVTSTNTGEHVSGSYHYQNRAVDIAGSASAMRKAFEYLAKNVPHGKLTELFYDPIGHYFDNGQKVPGAIGGHSDHVHLAI